MSLIVGETFDKIARNICMDGFSNPHGESVLCRDAKSVAQIYRTWFISNDRDIKQRGV